MPTGFEDFKIRSAGDATVIITLTDRAYRWMRKHYKNAPKFSQNEFILAPGVRDEFVASIPESYAATY